MEMKCIARLADASLYGFANALRVRRQMVPAVFPRARAFHFGRISKKMRD